MPIVTLIAAFVTLSATCAAMAQSLRVNTKPDNVNGIYIVTDAVGRFDDALLRSEGMDGVFIRLQWSTVNPAPGVYDFSGLTASLRKVAVAGKKASLAIMAGGYSPSWIFDQQGCKWLNLNLRIDPGKDGEKRIPIPWDKNCQFAYLTMIAALSQHLKARPVIDDIVVMVKMAAIVLGSAEMRLVQPRLLVNGAAEWNRVVRNNDRNTKNALHEAFDKAWQSSGYRPSLIVTAAHTLLEGMAQSFPDKVIGLAILVDPVSFPAIDENGELMNRRRVHTTRAIVNAAATKYGKKIAINSTVLKPTRGTPPVVDLASSRGALIGYQVAEHFIGHPNCNGIGAPSGPRQGRCDPEGFRMAMELGLRKGASFIEVFEYNVAVYSKILIETSRKLRNYWLDFIPNRHGIIDRV